MLLMLTVKELRKALKGVRGDTPVYIRDHDHGEWETNGLADSAELKNQRKMDEYDKEYLSDDFKIKGNYFVISA